MVAVAPTNQMTMQDALRRAIQGAAGDKKCLQDLLIAIILGNIGTELGSSGPNAGIVARSDGNFYAAAGTALAGNAAVTTNTVLVSVQIPAFAFDGIQNRIASLTAAGTFASNNNNKQINVYFGSDVQTVGQPVVTTNTTLIAPSGVVTTNGGGWSLQAQVMKYGAAGSNTQQGVNQGIIAGSTHLGTSAPVALTANEALPLYLTITGASSTSGNANDVVLQQVEALWND